MKARTVRVVLTCVGSPMAWPMIQSLQNASSLGIAVVGVDMEEQALGRHFLRHFHRIPSGKSADYVPAMIEVCRKEGAELVIPGSDEEAFSISRSIETFQKEGITCTVPKSDLIDAFSDKFVMYERLRNRGIKVPRYFRVSAPEDLKDAADRLGYPQKDFVLKVSSSRGGRGVWKITERVIGDAFSRKGDAIPELRIEEMHEVLKKSIKPPVMLAMETLAGDFYDVDVLSDRGRAVYTVARKRLNPMGIPFKGNVIEKNEEIITTAEEIRKALELNYLHDIDLCYSREAGVQIMEVNPRPSGSATATVEAGLNLFEFLVRAALGMEVPRQDIPWGKTILPKTVLFTA